MKLWYLQSARKWIECLALGNSRLGVMADAGAKRERLYLNEATLWSGYPQDDTNENSGKYLDEVRALIFDGQNAKAQQLIQKTSLGSYSQSFLPLATLDISYKTKGVVKNYLRQLDLDTAIHTKSFSTSKNNFSSQIFVSYAENAVFYTLECKNAVDFDVKLASKLKYNVEYCQNQAYIYGNAPDVCMPPYLKVKNAVQYLGKGMAYCLGLRIITDGIVESTDKKMRVRNATSVALVVTALTGFCGCDKMPITDVMLIKDKVRSVFCRDYDISAIKTQHIEDYKCLYDRVNLSLDCGADMPTDRLIKYAKKGCLDNRIIKLLYDFGRYLMISSSRDYGQPSNLQGLWNKDIRPAWSSNMTVNINTQMNYWMVGQCNLFECLIPYKNLLKELCVTGQKTARVNYNAGGFAVNHNVDIWRKTTPVSGNSVYAYFPMAGVWLANGMYSQFRCFFDRLNDEQLDELYQIVENTAQFVNDWLVYHDGHYHTAPSTSPEHQFVKDRTKLAIDKSSAIDIALVEELIENLVEICQKTQRSSTVLDSLLEKQKKLYPIQDGKYGIAEWGEDYEFDEKGHRHFSPLYALYPSRLTNSLQDMQRFKRFLDYRVGNGSGYTGWSAAWAACLYAGLREAENAYQMLVKLIKNSIFINLFDKHPPQIFQIDGNLGLVSAINMFFVQVKDDIIYLLPSLPQKLENGQLKGVLTEVGAILDIKWQNSMITFIHSNKKCKIKNQNIAENVVVDGEVKIIN